MSGFNLQTQGENVHLALSSTAAAVVSAALVILDANFVPRPLRTYERLIIDDLEASISAGSADVLAAAAGTTSTASSTLIAGFNAAVGLDLTAKEGISLPVGITPSVLPVGSGSTAILKVAGSGRIVEGTTQGPRPSWRENLTPGGNF